MEDQRREIEMAILNRGQYQFKNQYSSLAIGDKWFKLNKGQQEAHHKKFYAQKLQYDLGSPESTSASSSEVVTDNMPSLSKASNDLSTALSVNCKGFASRVNIPQSTIQAIWSKAETLLKADGSIVSAPGMASCWYVESRSKKVPHLVSVTQKGTISCDKACEHYRSIGICSYVVAIAEKVGSLKEFAQCFIKKKGTMSPNLGNFALTGMPPGRNRKGAVPPHKRHSKTDPSLLPHVSLTVSEPKSKDQVSVAVNDEHRANSSSQTFPYHQPFNSFQHMTFTPPPSYNNQNQILVIRVISKIGHIQLLIHIRLQLPLYYLVQVCLVHQIQLMVSLDFG